MTYICSPSEQDFTQEETYARTRRPVALAETIVPAAYTSDDFFALEQDRVFASGWVAVGPSAQLRAPGELLVCEVAGRSVIVVRGLDGELRGFYNTCRHRGTRLLAPGEGRVKRSIRCPYHSWAYSLDGSCIGTPLFEGSDIPEGQRGGVRDGRSGRLRQVRLRPAAASASAVGDRWSSCAWTAMRRRWPTTWATSRAGWPATGWTSGRWLAPLDYDIAANYKLVAENFMEYYHLPWVHPGLVKVSPIEAHHRWQGTGMYTGMCTNPIAADSDQGGWQSGLPAISRSQRRRRGRARASFGCFRTWRSTSCPITCS